MASAPSCIGPENVFEAQSPPGSSHITMTAGDGRGIPLIRVGRYRGKLARGGGVGPSPVSALRPPKDPRPLVQQPVCLPSLRVRLRGGEAAGVRPNSTAATADERETRRCPSAPPLRPHANRRRRHLRYCRPASPMSALSRHRSGVRSAAKVFSLTRRNVSVPTQAQSRAPSTG